MTVNELNSLRESRLTASPVVRLVVDTVSAAAALEQQVALAVHTVDTHMRITELVAEAEIAQDRIDRGRRLR